MTAPTDLPALLQRAAQTLPGCIGVGPFGAVLKVNGELEGFNNHDGSLLQSRLEVVCREEIEARGWTWMSGVYAPGEYRAVVETPMGHWNENAPTPAHAMLAALLSAVEAQA